jgi:gamma-glutamylcyclotransferase (GGCT)/AIG2-like uncharacterized protein YtfP
MTEISCEGRLFFAYGTLMFPAVIKSVIGRVPDSRPAVIEGYRRLEVTGELFPGLIKENDESVEGLVYLDITRNEWERLTAFEDDFYELHEVGVNCLGNDARALAFVVPPSRESVLSDKTWNPEFFREHHLAEYATKFGLV